MEIRGGLVTPTVLVSYNHILRLSQTKLHTLSLFMLLSSTSVFSDDEEDFRRTACTSLLQHVVETNTWRRDGAGGEEQKANTCVSDGN